MIDKATIVVPDVHMNGTSQSDLLAQRFNVIDAMHDAGQKLAHAAPNGRDFYTRGPHCMKIAMEQHDRRLNILRDLIAEFEYETEMLQDA